MRFNGRCSRALIEKSLLAKILSFVHLSYFFSSFSNLHISGFYDEEIIPSISFSDNSLIRRICSMLQAISHCLLFTILKGSQNLN